MFLLPRWTVICINNGHCMILKWTVTNLIIHSSIDWYKLTKGSAGPPGLSVKGTSGQMRGMRGLTTWACLQWRWADSAWTTRPPLDGACLFFHIHLGADLSSRNPAEVPCQVTWPTNVSLWHLTVDERFPSMSFVSACQSVGVALWSAVGARRQTDRVHKRQGHRVTGLQGHS